MNAWLWRLRFYVLAIIVVCLLPLLLLYLLYRLLIRRRPATGLWRKFSGCNPAPPQPGMILVHGVSMGEVMLMRPLIPLIEKQLEQPCVLSSSTDTGWRSLEKYFPDHHRCLFPLDLPWAIRCFFTKQRPSLIILLELEIWPLFLAAAFQRNIPVILLNARLGERSLRGYQRAPWFWRPIFRALRGAVAQNEQWADRLRLLGVQHVQTAGSLKADVIQCADEHTVAAERTRLQLDQRPVLLIASTSGDEEQTVLQNLGEHFKDWRIIICPRHPERGPAVLSMLRAHGHDGVCTGAQSDAPLITAAQIIIVDEIGRLAALYALADIAVVGGSLGSGRHGQNMLEAAAAGTCTVVGWDTSNQPDVMALLRQHQAVVACSDEAELARELAELAGNADRRQALGDAGRQAWQQSSGAAERSVALLAAMAWDN